MFSSSSIPYRDLGDATTIILDSFQGLVIIILLLLFKHGLNAVLISWKYWQMLGSYSKDPLHPRYSFSLCRLHSFLPNIRTQYILGVWMYKLFTAFLLSFAHLLLNFIIIWSWPSAVFWLFKNDRYSTFVWNSFFLSGVTKWSILCVLKIIKGNTFLSASRHELCKTQNVNLLPSGLYTLIC